MSEKIVLIGSPRTGEIRTLYSPDAVKVLSSVKTRCRAQRVSHIEVQKDRKGDFAGFYVDLRPVKGPVRAG